MIFLIKYDRYFIDIGSKRRHCKNSPKKNIKLKILIWLPQAFYFM